MLTRPPGGDLTIWFEGSAIPARAGDSVAVALLAAGILATWTTPLSGSPRGPFCLMGAECFAVVDGRCLSCDRTAPEDWRRNLNPQASLVGRGGFEPSDLTLIKRVL
jgi:hypothetical protein